MIQFFRSGGAPMFAILAFGLWDLVLAALFARRPEIPKLRTIGALGLAVLFSVGSGVMADVAAVGSTVPQTPEWANSPHIHLILLQGLAESMAPGILGFSILSLVAFLSAVGLSRQLRGA